MKKNVLVMGLVIALTGMVVTGCGSSGSKTSETKQSKKTVVEESDTKNPDSTAKAMKRTTNSNMVALNNAEGIYDEKKGNSWVKIATIWDPELTMYDAASYAAGTKAVVATFEVSGLDISDMVCYWNYMVADSNGTEISCWDTNYKTDDVKITKDGKYQMVFDVSKVEGRDVAEIKSLQLVFPNTSTATTTKVKVTDAVCVTDEKELGTIYKTGEVE